MPAINELDPVVAAADTDELPVSQGGFARRATRAQLLAGMQPALAMGPGLLGRDSGTGAPGTVQVGGGLRLQGGVLSAPAPFTLGALPAGRAMDGADGVAVRQGVDARVPYGQFMSGLGGLGGIALDNHAVRGRALADWMADAAPVEAFGAVGDGVTDDTDALDRAVQSGKPLRFGPRTYAVRGQWTIAVPAVLLGVPGRTVLRRTSHAFGGAFVSVQGGSFHAHGITFHAGNLGADTWGVLVAEACGASLFRDCAFTGARGATLGCGLVIGARDAGAVSHHRVEGCEAHGNARHGIWVQAAWGAAVDGCDAHHNGAYGICVDFNDAAFVQTVRGARVQNNHAWANTRGISVGNYNETNREPPRWGLGNPDAVGCVVSGNVCEGNSAYEVAASGRGLLVACNHLAPPAGGAGVLLNASHSVVRGNVVMGAPGAAYGVDSGGCVECAIEGNHVSGCAVGINPGGSQGVSVSGNTLSGNVWAITVYNVETDGGAGNFGLATDALTIEGNRIRLRGPEGGGILLMDAPQGVAVLNNHVQPGPDSSPSQALWAHTDALLLRGNTWNNGARLICNPQGGALAQVQVPDILDDAMVTSAPEGVRSIVGQHAAAMAGRVAYVRVTQGGSGYTQAAVSIGGTGQGAAAVAYVRDGRVVGVAITSHGAGYGAGAVSVVLTGDGTGAAAVGQAGVPVPEGRRLRLHCNGPVRFWRAGTVPFQDNWTAGDILLPAASVVEWVGAWGGWQAVSFPFAGYLSPPGDGSLVVRSEANDLTLRPARQLRVGSDGEPGGYAATLGRGSPEGRVPAPPGSDYRNLDGGAGGTLWVKRSGTGAAGWVAVA